MELKSTNKNIGIIVTFILIATFIAYMYVANKEMQFDAYKWKNSRLNPYSNLRLRMSLPLVKKIEDESWDYSIVLKNMGPPDSINNLNIKSTEGLKFTYDLGRRRIGPIAWSAYYLDIYFVENGAIASVVVRPE